MDIIISNSFTPFFSPSPNKLNMFIKIILRYIFNLTHLGYSYLIKLNRNIYTEINLMNKYLKFLFQYLLSYEEIIGNNNFNYSVNFASLNPFPQDDVGAKGGEEDQDYSKYGRKEETVLLSKSNEDKGKGISTTPLSTSKEEEGCITAEENNNKQLLLEEEPDNSNTPLSENSSTVNHPSLDPLSTNKGEEILGEDEDKDNNNNSVETDEEGFLGKLTRNFGFDNLASLWNRNNNSSTDSNSSSSNNNSSDSSNNASSSNTSNSSNINSNSNSTTDNNSQGKFFFEEDDDDSDFGDFGGE